MTILQANASLLDKAFGWFVNVLFEFVYKISPNYSLFITIILFTLVVKILLLPLMVKQQKSMKATQKIQPQIKAIQDKYKNKNDQESQAKMAQELQAVYSQNNASPFTGCLLSFIQIPIIYALFGVCKQIYLYITKLGDMYDTIASTIMTKVPNYIELFDNLALAKKLTTKKPMDFSLIENIRTLLITLSNNDWQALLGDMKDYIDINAINEILVSKNQIETAFGINIINRPSIHSFSIILPIITVALTYLSIRKSLKQNQDMDEQAAKMMKNMSTFMYVMMISIFFTSLSLPAALSIYWSTNTLLSMGQLWLVKKIVDMSEPKEIDKNSDAIDVNPKKIKEIKDEE